MLNLTELAKLLKEKTEWQETPYPITDSQYLGMVVRGLRRLFIDTGRAAQYDVMKYTTLEDEIGTYCYDDDFFVDEEEYIIICAQMEFFQKVQTDVNNQFGYSTDAITVTNADKPYANLKDTLDKLENDRRITYFKMVRFTI